VVGYEQGAAGPPTGDHPAVASDAGLAEEVPGSCPSPSTGTGRVLPATSLARAAAVQRSAGINTQWRWAPYE
jgi:hypothetical protein